MSIYRTTTLMSNNYLLSSLRQTQHKMMQVSEQMSTFKKVNRTSDAPSSTSAILLLERLQQSRSQYERNLNHAIGLLNSIDQSLDEATTLLLEAGSIASSQIGIGSTTETRRNQAGIVESQITAMLDIANRQIQGISLFGGDAKANAAGQVFVDFLGGYRYIGSTTNLTSDVGSLAPLAFNSNGVDSFGAVSSRVKGSVDLNPQATSATRISDVYGAQNAGVRPGAVLVTVNGVQAVVDLTSVDTLGDVALRINDAIAAVDPTAGGLNVTGHGFELTANAGHTISIAQAGSSHAATDLGLVLNVTSGTAAGADVNPRLTAQTTLASLGGGIDWTSGLKITQGTHTKVADFSAATTVQDLIHAVDQLNLGVKLTINEQGTGFDLVSMVSGLDWSVGENAGGSTATDLGLRSFSGATKLSDFNHGIGVSNVVGEPDFEIRLHDGRSFQVDLDGVGDVNGVIQAIATSATAAGITVGQPGDAGTDFNIGLASDGNGFSLEDGTAGPNDFAVANLGLSLAATDLGIYTNAESGSSIVGQDVAKSRVESALTHLIALRDSLLADDTRGITFAGDALKKDEGVVIQARGDVAVRAQRAEMLKARSEAEGITEKTALSLLVDVDMAEALTTFSALQTQLQASMQTGAQMMQRTLMDFLA